jgi:hypothetical protein
LNQQQAMERGLVLPQQEPPEKPVQREALTEAERAPPALAQALPPAVPVWQAGPAQ